MFYTGSTQNYEKESSSSPMAEIIQKLIKLRNACQLNTIRYTCNSCTEISDLHEVAERYSVLRRVRKDGRELPETKHVFFLFQHSLSTFFLQFLRLSKISQSTDQEPLSLYAWAQPAFYLKKYATKVFESEMSNNLH